ncbi:hypothetical protein [Actinopolymorpha pittospori]|uniref:Uncharacterized protein n=1 Tax=Actinopolymorpha pittospori TaxID=648752 RepID=A0A927RCU3_9ACTN|nr:hypothetical protein [Actinopolymorpha pittospori]MBE1610279.1 hypothetical protein [Actinopolymorpha pittospori]
MDDDSSQVSRASGAPQGRESQGATQRNAESVALLKQLAVPKIADGPAIAVQKKLVEDLEKLFQSEASTEINLGGILIERLPDRYDGNDDLFTKAVQQAKLVQLPGTILGARSGGSERAGLVIQAGLGPALIENTLKTMIDAKQLEYLRLVGLPNGEWKILVEVHYIRSRPKDATGLHKDTKGETLFVNLNYHVGDNKVMGPEYVLNPAPSPEHDALIKGTDGKPGTLPKVFTDDLDEIRRTLGKPTEIRTGIVNPYGYVAFVDEAIHHATPLYGHRFITGKEFRAYLAQKYPAELAEITRADKEYQASRWPAALYAYSTYVNKTIIAEGEIAKWLNWLGMTGDANLYTRVHFAATMTSDEIDLMLHTVGSWPGAQRRGVGGFYAASIPQAPTLSPVNEPGSPPLKRQASTADFKKDQPPPLPDDVPRRFLRSWIRVVPESMATRLREYRPTQGQ